MARSLGKLKWHDPCHALTAFLTVIVMPLTYSIGKLLFSVIILASHHDLAYGLIAGICCYIILEGTFLLLSFAGIERPSFDEEHQEVAAKQLGGSSDSDGAEPVDEADMPAEETDAGKDVDPWVVLDYDCEVD